MIRHHSLPIRFRPWIILAALSFPILSPLNAGDHEILPVSFQPPGSSFHRENKDEDTLCPDLYQADSLATPICAISGTVDTIQLGQNDRIAWLVISVAHRDFYYFPKGGDSSTPLALFTASRIHQVPVSLRFQNWGGRYYITEANF